MAKRIISTVIALVFIVSMVVIPTSADVPTSGTTESGYPIPELCARTNEPDVTNYCFELKRALPSKVVKDGVIDVEGGEYYPLGIPREEIILKGSNDQYSPALARSQAMKESVEAYVSWDYDHGVNFAVQYTSPETPVQQFSSLYYDGRVTPLPGSTKDSPLYNDTFNDDGTFRAIEDNFWANTAFSVQFGDKTGRAFYYVVGRNTDTGEYLMGHYFFSDLSGNGWGQYGYDPTYIPVGGEDLIITYGPDNLVTMEWSVPFSTILGRDPEDGEKIGFSITLTQGTAAPNADEPWKGDLENNAAILLGNNAGFQSLAAKPTRTKTQKVYDPVTDQQITKKCAGNLPMVAIFNTTAPEGGEPEPDPMIEEIDDRYDELACVAHGLLDLVFGTSATVYSLPDVLTEIFGYPASMDPDDIEEIKNDYGGLGDGQTAWPGEYTVTFTNPDTGAEYDKDIDFALYKAVGGKYCGAIEDTGFLGCCPDEWPEDAAAARNAVDDRHNAGWPDYWNEEDVFTIPGDEYTEAAIEAWYRDVTGLGDGWEFYIENFDETKAYEGNAVNIGLRNDDINEEGRTVIIYCAPTLKIAAAEELSLTGSLTLNDDVEINIAVNGVSAELADGGYVIYNRSDEEEQIAYFDAAHLVEDGKYKFTVASCDAIHLADPVYFSIFDANGEFVSDLVYSAKDYCDTVVTGSDYEQGLKDLCSALMAYGYYADMCFSGGTSADYFELYGDAISAVRGVRPARMGTYPSEAIYGDPVTGIGASLALKSRVELSLFVKGVSELNDVMVFVGDEAWDNYEVVTSPTKCRVIIKGLRAVDLKDTVELVCAEASVTYSPMACAKALVSNGTEYADVCRALYLYSTAAIAFFTD